MSDALPPLTKQAEYNRRYRARHPERARSLQAAHQRLYRATSAGSATRRRYETSEVGRIKTNARLRLRRAVMRGRVQRLACEIWSCRSEQSEAHHPFGYVGALALAVWWLCRPHHAALHRAVAGV